MNRNPEKKEDFCIACAAIPMAMAGAGASAYGANQKGSHKKMKDIMLWGGLAVTAISVLIAIYFLFIRKCKNCR